MADEKKDEDKKKILKQGEVVKITQKDESEFKEATVIKKTEIITMQNGKPTRIYFEDGKQTKAAVI